MEDKKFFKILALFMLISVQACAKKPEQKEPPAQAIPPAVVATPVDEAALLAEKCSVKFLTDMTLPQIMVASDQMHRDCDYNEEQVLTVAKLIFSKSD